MVSNNKKYVSLEGMTFKVIEITNLWCTIYCEHNNIMSRAKASDIECEKARLLRNHGGYVCTQSVEEYNSIIKTNAYACWNNMLYRVGRGAYKDVKIHEDWLCFQNFKTFYDTWYIEGFALDKDLLSEGQKMYGPDTCCFIPKALNSALWEVGTHKTKSEPQTLSFTMSFHIGGEVTVPCKNKEERDKLYKLYRIVKVRTLLSLFDTQIMDRAVEKIHKLYNYKDYVKNID
jgi:hypothetical protein